MDANQILLETLCDTIATQKEKIKELETKLLEKENFIDFIISENGKLKIEKENLIREIEGN